MSLELTDDGPEALELRYRPPFGETAFGVVWATIFAVVWFALTSADGWWFWLGGSLPMLYFLFRLLRLRAVEARFDKRAGTLRYRRSGAAGSRRRETVEEIPLSEIRQLFVRQRPKRDGGDSQLFAILREGRLLPLSGVDLLVDLAQDRGERIRRFLGIEPIVRITQFQAPLLA